MGTSAVSALDLRKHTVDNSRGKVVPRRRTNYFEPLPDPSARFTSACQVECLADPLGDGLAAGARYTLNFAVFGILYNYLQPLGSLWIACRPPTAWKRWRLRSLGQQLEIHHYRRIDFDRISIQKRWAVAPSTDCFDGGAREFGVDLGAHHAERQRIALHSNDGME